MVRTIKAEYLMDDSGKKYYELAGLSSTDEKPTEGDIATGSLFLEVDTGDVYAYDEAGTEWNKIAALGGGGT